LLEIWSVYAQFDNLKYLTIWHLSDRICQIKGILMGMTILHYGKQKYCFH